MKNIIQYKGLNILEKNKLNLEKLVFLRDRESLVHPQLIFSNQLNTEVVEHVKQYLEQEKFRELIQNSFGDNKKKEQLRTVINTYISSKDFLSEYSTVIASFTLDEITDHLVEKIAGLGVLQQYADIPTITDIKCLAYDNIWVDDIYKGKYKTMSRFESKEEFLELCTRFSYASGQNFSMSKPSVNAMFPYMRINFVGKDLSDNVTLAIRLVSKGLRFNEKDMLETGYANMDMINFLKATFATESHLIAGATGASKTELLRYMTRYTKDYEDIIMIEDTPETYLDELYDKDIKPITMWKNRNSDDDEGKSFGYLYHIRNAMRHHPMYIFLQECLGKEALEVLKAAETGHIVNTTLHSETANDAVFRMIDLCQEALPLPTENYGKRITRKFRIGVHTKRIKKIRRVHQIVEYIGFDNMEVKSNLLFEYDTVTNTHIQKGKMSEELWDRLLEEHEDLSSIECLSPYNKVLLHA